MCIPSYLLFFLLIAHAAYGYTVVLASGKRIEGTFFTDQQNTIVIRDSQGVLISFKKNMLDLQAMSAANRIEPSASSHDVSSKRKVPPTIAELAAETRRKRTGNAKAMSLDDIDQKPELSIFGSSERADQTKTSRTKAAPVEREWISRLWALKKEVNRLREKYIAAESSCEEAREKQHAARVTPSRKPVDLMSTFKESSQCRKSSELASQLHEAEVRLENAREEARRAGVSWQALE